MLCCLMSWSLLVVLGRSKTAPCQTSYMVDIGEDTHNLSRSKTEKKEKDLKLSEADRHSSRPAEKLSERERVKHCVFLGKLN